MRTVLIVSPHFPPVNGADMHRVRVSLPYYPQFGWSPRVLAVEPRVVENAWLDPALADTVPESVPVRRVSAIPLRYTRRIGFGALAFRALPQLYRAGTRWIQETKPDLVFFSTTQFPVMVLGRLWQRRFGVPYLLDMQDPWATGLPSVDPAWEKPLKHRLMRAVHRKLEPFAMRDAAGLMAVAQPFIDALHAAYPVLRSRPAAVIRFGASSLDLELLARRPVSHDFFSPRDGCFHGVYVGRGGYNLAPALRILFRALAMGLRENPERFRRVRLHFVGTDYAPPGRERKTIEPLAAEFGVGAHVSETPLRVPYFTAMQLQMDADFLVLPGSEEAEYAASKLCGCILSRKPLLALFHEQSNATALLRATRAGDVLTFTKDCDHEAVAAALFQGWNRLLTRLPFSPDTDWAAFGPYRDRELTRQQCELFDQAAAIAK